MKKIILLISVIFILFGCKDYDSESTTYSVTFAIDPKDGIYYDLSLYEVSDSESVVRVNFLEKCVYGDVFILTPDPNTSSIKVLVRTYLSIFISIESWVAEVFHIKIGSDTMIAIDLSTKIINQMP
jgi:hypothetical protein